MLGYELPFDRHDWVVERADGGVQARYNGHCPLPPAPPKFLNSFNQRDVRDGRYGGGPHFANTHFNNHTLPRHHPHHGTSHTPLPRYVLDFYKGKIHPSSRAAIGMHLDVRPALDSPTAFMDRAYVFGMQVLYCCPRLCTLHV